MLRLAGGGHPDLADQPPIHLQVPSSLQCPRVVELDALTGTGWACGDATFHLLMHSGFTLNIALALSTGAGACFNYFAGRSAVRSRPKPAVEDARES